MKTVVNLKIPISFFKEGKTFIAYSPVLDLSTSASSFKKAQERFSEVVQIFFEELTEKETTDEVLSGLGWVKIKKEWTPPIPISHELTDISVPIAN